jgi:enterochelin esterase family protein
MRTRFGLATWLLSATLAPAQPPAASPAPPPPRPNVQSPVVDGGRVTFSVYAPSAGSVQLRSPEIDRLLPGPKPGYAENGEWIASPKPLARGANGVWTVTVGPLPPGIYDYTFDVDGVVTVDPVNGEVVGNTRGSRGLVEIPGPPGQPRHDEWREVPHGAVTVHWYDSKVTGSRRRVHVYTPPGYEAAASRRYPALYLLHGASGHDGQWTQIGRANVIADNLVADGKAVPMVIVMPDGHAYRPPPGTPDAEKLRTERFEGDLLQEVIPLVERVYHVDPDRQQRAIAGLSMGGGQALAAALRHGDRFAWMGGFSSSLGWALPLVPASGEAAAALNARTRLLWIRIGTDDYASLVKLHRQFIADLKAAGVRYEYLETDGAHMWSVWRRYLADFLPRLFHT